ncbi:hypothetical protein K2173_020551 [Erythroxylum novogranatense]|uniref:DUF4283 domain-containing protein n=1 Tax=Erythroxylum novogranatense TaxID=1862640 RepID=A0AAV8TJ41_9ROSI|nr:hypothetical protein K2173_020551 [Erythroxylum novogranatense]
MASLGHEGHLPKKVRLRDCDEEPPDPKPSYSAILGHSTVDVEPVTRPWPNEELIEAEEGDITQLKGDDGTGVLLSKTFKEKLDKQWEQSVSPNGPMKVIDLDYDYFLVKFIDHNDFINALTNGPRVIFGHALSIQQWTPEFRPSNGKITRAVTWIRFPELSIDRYHPLILSALGNQVGHTVKLDESTRQTQRGRFLRVAVDIDLTVPLRTTVELDASLFKLTTFDIRTNISARDDRH